MKNEGWIGLWILLALSGLLAVACGGAQEPDAGPDFGGSAAPRGDAEAVKTLLEDRYQRRRARRDR